MTQTTYNYLIDLGFRADLKGFEYIGYCIENFFNDDWLSKKLTEEIYPSIAKAYNLKSWTAVERTMRYSIQDAFVNGNLNQFNRWDSKPTNKVVLTVMFYEYKFILRKEVV